MVVTRILSALLLAALALLGWQTYRLQALRLDVAEQRATDSESYRLASRAATNLNATVDHATQTRINTALATAAAARNDADGLRDALAATRAAAAARSASGCADESATIDRLARLLSEGTSLVEEGTARGGELATQVTGFHELTRGTE